MTHVQCLLNFVTTISLVYFYSPKIILVCCRSPQWWYWAYVL